MKIYRIIWSDGACDHQEWFSAKGSAEIRARAINKEADADNACSVAAFDIPPTKAGILAFLNTHCDER